MISLVRCQLKKYVWSFHFNLDMIDIMRRQFSPLVWRMFVQCNQKNNLVKCDIILNSIEFGYFVYFLCDSFLIPFLVLCTSKNFQRCVSISWISPLKYSIYLRQKNEVKCAFRCNIYLRQNWQMSRTKLENVILPLFFWDVFPDLSIVFFRIKKKVRILRSFPKSIFGVFFSSIFPNLYQN